MKWLVWGVGAGFGAEGAGWGASGFTPVSEGSVRW